MPFKHKTKACFIALYVKLRTDTSSALNVKLVGSIGMYNIAYDW